MDLLQSAEFSDRTQKAIDRHHVTGLAIALVQDGKLASKGFGKASLNPPRDFTADSLICVGSASKSLTAAAVALMVNDDEKYPEVQYEATMSSLLPDDFVMPGTDHAHVTLEDVLSHRTGMPPHEMALFGAQAKSPNRADDARSITRKLRHLPVVAANGEKFVYCNMMYTAASHLVEQKSGTSFSDFLEENLLGPLRLDSTALLLERAQEKGLGHRVAAGYVRSRKTGQPSEAPPLAGTPESQGAGQIFSTANDYAKWVKAMMHREGPITDRVYQGLTKKRMLQDPPAEGMSEDQMIYYSFGWDVRQYRGHTIVSHDGGDIGCQCNHFFVPELKFGGAIFSNSDHAGPLVSQLTFQVIDEVLQGPQPAKSLRPRSDVSTSGSGTGSGSGSGSDSDADEADDADGSDADDSDSEYMAEVEEELLQELCPGIKGREPQKLPLGAYVGQYRHAGYGHITVEERDGSLVVDAMDRSLGFILTLQHVCGQTKYLARLKVDSFEDDSLIKGEFDLDKEQRATRVGLHLEDGMDEYVWFDRVE
ncbi:hypothetical protein RJ55_03170 [Drechmeria coniospora]|nr:hypothetical protein RJ55_03170 [Drechmeria coniospora]